MGGRWHADDAQHSRVFFSVFSSGSPKRQKVEKCVKSRKIYKYINKYIKKSSTFLYSLLCRKYVCGSVVDGGVHGGFGIPSGQLEHSTIDVRGVYSVNNTGPKERERGAMSKKIRKHEK